MEWHIFGKKCGKNKNKNKMIKKWEK